MGGMNWICKLPAGFVIMSVAPLVVRNDTGIDAYVYMADGEKIRVNRGEERQVWPVDEDPFGLRKMDPLEVRAMKEDHRRLEDFFRASMTGEQLEITMTEADAKDCERRLRQMQASNAKLSDLPVLARARPEDLVGAARATLPPAKPEPRLLGVVNDPNGGGVRKVYG